MAPPLPDDLIGLIVSQVTHPSGDPRIRDLASLCLAETRFAPDCQKALFRNVTIHPVPDRRRVGLSRYLPTKRKKAYENSVQFARAVSGTTRLARLVRSLDIRLPTKDLYKVDAGQDEIVGALRKLEELSSLTISPSTLDRSLPNERVVYHDSMPRVLQEHFGYVLRGPQLRHLTVTNMISLPGCLIVGAPQLQVLELRNGTITRDAIPA